MWMVHPARIANNYKDQMQKTGWVETVAFVSVLINTTVTSVLAALLMEGEGNLTSLKLSASQEFLVIGGGPAVLSHILGGVFLILYYSCQGVSEI